MLETPLPADSFGSSVRLPNRSLGFLGTFKLQLWDLHRQAFLESAPGLGLFVTVTTYNEEVV